ncbi:MAG TPA: S41 family peptidase [Gemmatimonadaceae bacterium]
MPPGAKLADFKIDATARTAAIEGAIAKLEESYVFPEVAKKMGEAVRDRLKSGEYDDMTNGITFANVDALVIDLRDNGGGTFSGGGEFTNNLKALKRATIVGETTGGGAHPVAGQRINDHFMIGVPFARAINPITKTNWERTGIEPDVKVAAPDALTTALKLIAEQRALKS